MSIAKMSTLHNSYRFFTIAVDKYEGRCMEGIIYQAGKIPGIRYDNFFEMVIQMNRIFDKMSCPKQAMELRRFSGTRYPEPVIRECNHYRSGSLATFQIYVKFRYNASWQGDITWLEGKQTESFESLLMMMYFMDWMLTGNRWGEAETVGRTTAFCRLSINSYNKGELAGSVQNASINYMEEFSGIIGLADVMKHILARGIRKDTYEGQPDEGNIVSEEMWKVYRKGGKKATFMIRILFHEHDTWQGVIRWRETGERQSFRSFLELMLLIAAVTGNVENGKILTENRKEIRIPGILDQTGDYLLEQVR